MQDPIGSFDRIRELYISYLDTAFRIREPAVAEERRRLLREPGTLCTEPLIEPIARYESDRLQFHTMLAPSGDDDPLKGFSAASRTAFVDLVLAGLFPSREKNAGSVEDAKIQSKRIGLFSPYKHQVEMLRRGARSGSPGVVTSGTGSGKTEAFLLPILAQIAREAVNWQKPQERFLKRRWWHDSAGKPYTKRNRKNEQVISFAAIPSSKRPSSSHPLRTPFESHRLGETRPAAVRALLLYPMNALVEDQMVRLRKALDSNEAREAMENRLNGNRVFFGRYTGQAPVTGHLEHPGLRTLLKTEPKDLPDQALYFPEHKNAEASTGKVPLEKVRETEFERRKRRLEQQFDFSVDAEEGQFQARLFALDEAANRRLEQQLHLLTQSDGKKIQPSTFIEAAKKAGRRQAGALSKMFEAIVGRAPQVPELKELEDLDLTSDDAKRAPSAIGDDSPFLFPSTDGSELSTRWDMQAAPPDILVTNVSMLSAMLGREVDAPIFEQTKCWLEENDDACFFFEDDSAGGHGFNSVMAAS